MHATSRMQLPPEVQLTSSLAVLLPPIPQSASPLPRFQSLQLVSILGVQLPTLTSCMQGLCIAVGTHIRVGFTPGSPIVSHTLTDTKPTIPYTDVQLLMSSLAVHLCPLLNVSNPATQLLPHSHLKRTPPAGCRPMMSTAVLLSVLVQGMASCLAGQS